MVVVVLMVVLVHKNQLWLLVLMVVQVLMVHVHDGLAILVLLQVHTEVVDSAEWELKNFLIS